MPAVPRAPARAATLLAAPPGATALASGACRGPASALATVTLPHSQQLQADVRTRSSDAATGRGTGPWDRASCYLGNLPVLHFFTDLHDDDHRTTDDAERIGVGGMARVAPFAERISRARADRPARVTVTVSRGKRGG